MYRKTGSEGTGGGAFFACIMILALSVVSGMFAFYITPVFAEAATGQEGWDPEKVRIILYLLNWGLIPFSALAAVYCLIRVHLCLRDGMSDLAVGHGVWALGFTIASVTLLAIQIFVAIGFMAVWAPGQPVA